MNDFKWPLFPMLFVKAIGKPLEGNWKRN